MVIGEEGRANAALGVGRRGETEAVSQVVVFRVMIMMDY